MHRSKDNVILYVRNHVADSIDENSDSNYTDENSNYGSLVTNTLFKPIQNKYFEVEA